MHPAPKRPTLILEFRVIVFHKAETSTHCSFGVVPLRDGLMMHDRRCNDDDA